MTGTGQTALVRSLRTRDLTGVVINGVIGAGIFGLPAKVFALSGDYSLFAFLGCALCVLVIVLSISEVASRFSDTGGPYLYAREAFGRTTGFVVGWLIWVARVSAFAANCNLLPEYLAQFYPPLASGTARVLLLTLVIGALSVLNIRGIRPVATASNTFAVGKLLPLFFFGVAGLFFLNPAHFSFVQPPAYSSFSLSVLLLVFAFSGFEMAVIPAGEAKDPQRSLPVALLSGMAVVITVYVMIQIVCIGTLPGLGASKRPLSDAASLFLGPWGAALMAIGIVLSLAGNLNVLLLSASRVLFAMGERGDLPARLAMLHPLHRTPAFAIVLTTAAILILALSGTFVYLVTISTLSRLTAYVATCAALPVFRRRPDAPQARFSSPGGVPVALAGVVIGLWLLSSSTLREAQHTAYATAIGLAIFFAARRNTPQEEM